MSCVTCAGFRVAESDAETEEAPTAAAIGDPKDGNIRLKTKYDTAIFFNRLPICSPFKESPVMSAKGFTRLSDLIQTFRMNKRFSSKKKIATTNYHF
jgi:hypothetical protein